MLEYTLDGAKITNSLGVMVINIFLKEDAITNF